MLSSVACYLVVVPWLPSSFGIPPHRAGAADSHLTKSGSFWLDGSGIFCSYKLGLWFRLVSFWSCRLQNPSTLLGTSGKSCSTLAGIIYQPTLSTLCLTPRPFHPSHARFRELVCRPLSCRIHLTKRILPAHVVWLLLTSRTTLLWIYAHKGRYVRTRVAPLVV